mmetsp:Transcript_5070/g.17286  ORF Transcript_5070/g.17286 Transcript_5070/m.17286 type:complete len:384 (+) Transcript_5070:919-2070(+)
MGDIADVGLVDAQTEGDRRTDDRHGPAAPRVVDAAPALVGQARVVRRGAEAARPQARRHVLALLLAEAVDDARRRPADLVDERGERRDGVVFRRRLPPDLEEEVRPVTLAAEPHRPPAEAQDLLDVSQDPRRRRRRERENRHPRKRGAQASELGVVGPVVVAPRARAVRLVDDEARQPARLLALLERRQQPLRRRDALGRHEDDPARGLRGARRRLAQVLERRVERVAARRRRQRDGAQAEVAARARLVLDERDERAHDDGRRRRPRERRQLVAQRLAAAGAQHREDVAPRERGVDDLALQRAERRERAALQRGVDGAIPGLAAAPVLFDELLLVDGLLLVLEQTVALLLRRRNEAVDAPALLEETLEARFDLDEAVGHQWGT